MALGTQQLTYRLGNAVADSRRKGQALDQGRSGASMSFSCRRHGMSVAINTRSLAFRAVGTQYRVGPKICRLSRGFLEFGPLATSRTDISAKPALSSAECVDVSLVH